MVLNMDSTHGSWKMERTAVTILKTTRYLGLTMSHRLTQSTSLSSSLSLPLTNTSRRSGGTNRSLTWSSNSCSSTSLGTFRTKLGKLNRHLRTILLGDVTSSGLLCMTSLIDFLSVVFFYIKSSSDVSFLDHIPAKVFNVNMVKPQFLN